MKIYGKYNFNFSTKIHLCSFFEMRNPNRFRSLPIPSNPKSETPRNYPNPQFRFRSTHMLV